MSEIPWSDSKVIDTVETLRRGMTYHDKNRWERIYVGFDDQGLPVKLATFDMVAWEMMTAEGRRATDRYMWTRIIEELPMPFKSPNGDRGEVK